tara:strand:- start:8203 stop:9384 length:1182 start_codon:yes stop_codon:yes gene_type:complete
MVQRKLSIIPQAIPNLKGNEIKYLKKCIKTGYVASSGTFLNKFKKKISNMSGGGYVTLTSSGSSAIHTSLLALSIKKGSMIFVPSYTFIATANAIKLSGAEPFFVDIKKDTLNINEKLIEKIIKEKCFLNKNGNLIYKKNKKIISAIMPVFTLGMPADMNELKAICKKYNLKLIVDAACAIGSQYKNSKLNEMGADLSILSFNANKIITSGGGGAIISRTKSLYKMTEYYSSNSKKYKNKYIFDDIGFNHRMNNIQAAVGYAQIELLNLFLKKKKYIRNFYDKNLKKEILLKFITKLPIKNDRKSSNWLSGYLINHKYEKLKKYLNNNNIHCEDFWKPCHLQKPYLKSQKSSMKITNSIWNKILILPSSTSIKDKDLKKIVSKIKKFYNNKLA